MWKGGTRVARPWRRSFFGYQVLATEQFLSDLESQLDKRQQQRESQITALRLELREAEEAGLAAEATVKELQQEYFRLSAELTTLTARAQDILGGLQQQHEQEEQEFLARLDLRRQYADHLSKTIQNVPQKIRSLIEEIAGSMTESPSSRDVVPIEPPALENPEGRIG